MDESTLEKIWTAIESLIAVLTTISERLATVEARADDLHVPGSDPIGEKLLGRPSN